LDDETFQVLQNLEGLCFRRGAWYNASETKELAYVPVPFVSCSARREVSVSDLILLFQQIQQLSPWLLLVTGILLVVLLVIFFYYFEFEGPNLTFSPPFVWLKFKRRQAKKSTPVSQSNVDGNQPPSGSSEYRWWRCADRAR
jgi:hypothetical protein